MAFTINKIRGSHVDLIQSALATALAQSRFTARIELYPNKLTIHDIRLKQSKHYCGNHPFACPVTPFERPHKKAKYLEGADWVAFNDMVNDVIDSLGASANVGSSLCIIRKGELRRVEYNGHAIGMYNFEWDKDSPYYEDWRGKQAPPSKFPQGTPGIAAWKQ